MNIQREAIFSRQRMSSRFHSKQERDDWINKELGNINAGMIKQREQNGKLLKYIDDRSKKLDNLNKELNRKKESVEKRKINLEEFKLRIANLKTPKEQFVETRK